MNNLDWYESWAKEFCETAQDFGFLDIHKPKIQTHDL